MSETVEISRCTALTSEGSAGLPSEPARAPRRTALRFNHFFPLPALASFGPRLLPPGILLFLLLGGWEITAISLDSALMPRLSEIAEAIVRIIASGAVAENMPVTLERVAIGLLLSLLLALPIGIAMGLKPSMQGFFKPAVLIGLAMPGLAWSLMTIVWFGASIAAPVASIVLVGTPALVLNIYQGVMAVDADLVEMSHVFKYSLTTRIRYLYLPSLTPFLLSGTRLGLSLSWKVVVVSEIFGLSSGVGYQMSSAFSNFDIATMFAWTAVFTGLMMAIEYGVLAQVERRITAWRKVASL